MMYLIENKRVINSLKIIFLVVWLGVIFWFSSIPQLLATFDSPWEIIIRKWAHFFEFALLLFLIYKAITIKTNSPFRRYILIAIGLTILVAISDEFHQTLVDGRHGTILDVTIDSFGILTSAWLLLLEREHQEKYPKIKHLFIV